MAAVVEFICISPTHMSRTTDSGTLSINERSWAFCASGEIGEHIWSALPAAVEIELLRRDWRRFVPKVLIVDPPSAAATSPEKARRMPR